MELSIKQIQNTIKTLVQNNIHSIEHLKKLEDEDIRRMHSVGTKKIRDIKALINVNEKIDVFKYFGPNSIQPEGMVNFFHKHQIHQGNVLQTKLAEIGKVEKLTKGKTGAFFAFKNKVFRHEYNHTLVQTEQSREEMMDELMQVVKSTLISYLSKETLKYIEVDMFLLVDSIGFEQVNIKEYGKEIVEYLDIEYLLVQHNDDLDKEILFQVIYKERKPISMFVLKQRLQQIDLFNLQRLTELLNILVQEGYVVYTSYGIKYNTPSSLQYVASRQKDYPYTYERLHGKTLEEIGKEENITRERVRQKFVKEIGNFPLDRFFENRVAPFYESYNLTQEEFCKVFQFNDQQYNFLKLFFTQNKELKSKEELMDSGKLERKEKEQLFLIINKDYIFINGHRVKKNRIGIIAYAVKIYARESIRLKDFQGKVIDFCKEHSLDEEFDFSEIRALEGVVSRIPTSLWKFGKKLRYYAVDQELVIEALSQIKFNRYLNQELSAKRILDDYPELFKEIDIQDEYELHNLLRRNEDLVAEKLSFKRMPMLDIGKTDREEQLINLLIECGKIDKNDFAALYTKKYGVLIETVKANYLPLLREFEAGSQLDADVPPVEPKTLEWLNSHLTKEFYFKEDIYEKYAEEFDGEVLRDYVFNLVNYTNYSEFILKGETRRADKYFEERYFNKSIFTIEDNRLKYLGSFRKRLESLRASLDIFEFAENEFIHFNMIQSKTGIGKEAIRQLINEILEEVGDRYFTIPMVEPIIEKSSLYRLGFDDIFYESILKGHGLLRYQYMGGRVVFRKTKDKFYIHELIEEVVSRMKAIDIYDLIHYLEETYSIVLSKEAIIQRTEMTDLYYHPVLEMVFQDVEQFYEFMEED